MPLGAWRRWTFVRGFWWRALHLASLVAVAAQALIGRACFLTLWQADLEGGGKAAPPLVYLGQRVDLLPSAAVDIRGGVCGGAGLRAAAVAAGAAAIAALFVEPAVVDQNLFDLLGPFRHVVGAPDRVISSKVSVYHFTRVTVTFEL